MEILSIFANCQMARCAKETALSQSRGCDPAVWITIIICATILLMALVLTNILCRMKEKQLEAKKEEEKELYRAKLLNIYEIRAKGLMTQDRQNLSFDTDWCNAYIAELKSLIKDLKPADKPTLKNQSTTTAAPTTPV